MSGSLGFWARRKALVRQEEEAETRDREAADDAARQAALADRSDEEVLADLGLPDPDTMQPGDDFSAFLAREVPQRLQRRALRRLWVSNPVLACVDGLNDYDGDFTAGATGNGVIKTAYQVGRGIVREAVAAQDIPARDRPTAAPDPQLAEAAPPAGPQMAGQAFDGTAPDETAPDETAQVETARDQTASEQMGPGQTDRGQTAQASASASDMAPAATCALTAAVNAGTDGPGTETAQPIRRRMRFAFDGATAGTETG